MLVIVPDLIINSAGVVQPGYVQDLEIEHFHWMMDINYHGTVHVIKAFLPEMMQRKSGYIINIASGGGLMEFLVTLVTAVPSLRCVDFQMRCAGSWLLTRSGFRLFIRPIRKHPNWSMISSINHQKPKRSTETAGRMTADEVAKDILNAASRGKR